MATKERLKEIAGVILKHQGINHINLHKLCKATHYETDHLKVFLDSTGDYELMRTFYYSLETFHKKARFKGYMNMHDKVTERKGYREYRIVKKIDP